MGAYSEELEIDKVVEVDPTKRMETIEVIGCLACGCHYFACLSRCPACACPRG